MYMGMVGNALRAEVKSHYNPITNHCYALVDIRKNSGYKRPKTPNNYKSLAWYDAQSRDILLSASQEGDAKSENDFRGDIIFSTYEKVSDQINVLMTQ